MSEKKVVWPCEVRLCILLDMLVAAIGFKLFHRIQTLLLSTRCQREKSSLAMEDYNLLYIQDL